MGGRTGTGLAGVDLKTTTT